MEKDLTAVLDHRFAFTVIDDICYAAAARWRSLRKLELEIRRMDAMSGVRLILKFEEEQLQFEADETLMTDGGLGMLEKRLTVFRQVADLDGIVIEKTGNNPGVEKEK